MSILGKKNTFKLVKTNKISILILILILIIGLGGLFLYRVKEGYFSISNNFSKDDTNSPMCLDVINDGINNKLKMARCGYLTGQQWSAVTVDKDKHQFSLKNNFTGSDKCLDVINNGKNNGLSNQLQMTKCGNYSGQQWFSDINTYHLTNNFTTSTRCLDIINDGANNKLNITNCGNNYTGQQWYSPKINGKE